MEGGGRELHGVRAPSSSSRACSTPLRQDSLQRDTPGARPVSADKVDDVMDCSTWTAKERIAQKGGPRDDQDGHKT